MNDKQMQLEHGAEHTTRNERGGALPPVASAGTATETSRATASLDGVKAAECLLSADGGEDMERGTQDNHVDATFERPTSHRLRINAGLGLLRFDCKIGPTMWKVGRATHGNRTRTANNSGMNMRQVSGTSMAHGRHVRDTSAEAIVDVPICWAHI